MFLRRPVQDSQGKFAQTKTIRAGRSNEDISFFSKQLSGVDVPRMYTDCSGCG